ncbi:MAG: glycosyltransferase [Clostridia bacterium]|nr:glycosyltransferase [Clostridia bacterium]
MKILLINNCYPFGSTGKIVKSLEDCYNHLGHKTVLIYGQGPKTYADHYRVTTKLYRKIQALISRITGIMYGGCFLSTNKVIRIIKKSKPDVVHLHCLNSHFINIYRIITWLKNNNVQTVITNHAEFLYTANCGHALDCEKYQTGCGNCPRLKKETKSWFIDGTHKSWIKMKKAFDGFDSLIVTNVSPWLNERALSSEILKSFDHYTVLNGVDTTVFYYRDNYQSNEEKVVFHATANFSDDPNDLKGGRFLIEIARKFEDRNVKFIVAGKSSVSSSIPSNMILLGHITDQNELAELYSKADLVVITSQKETFSMITAESLCCGTPVVGFKAGGPEMITILDYSKFVEYGNIADLYDATNRLLYKTFDKKTVSKAAKEKFSMSYMAQLYIAIYQEMIGCKNNENKNAI